MGPKQNKIGTTAIKAAKMIQAMRSKKIKFEFDEDDGEILLSYDTVNFGSMNFAWNLVQKITIIKAIPVDW